MILALDLGTNTGWATSDANFFVSGTEKFVVDRFSGGGMRYLRFKRWLDEMNNGTSDRISEVWFEEVRRHAGTTAAHVYGGFLGVLTAWCEEKKIPYQGVPVGTIKKFATGKGNASKKEMIAALGPDFRGDDNQADAIHLLRYAKTHA